MDTDSNLPDFSLFFGLFQGLQSTAVEYPIVVRASDIVEEDQIDPDDSKAFLKIKRHFIKAVQAGHLVVDEKGQPVFTPQGGDGGPITFFEPKGGSVMAMDTQHEKKRVHQMHALIAHMTQQPMKRFADMPMRDYAIVQMIALLFLG